MRSPSSKYLYGRTSTFGTNVNVEKDVRRQRDETCSYCLKYQPGEMYPPHDASRFCESGKLNHCTCNWCF